MSKLIEKVRARFKLAEDADEAAMAEAFEHHMTEHEKLTKEHAELSEVERQRKLTEAAECADRALRDYGLPASARAVLTAQCLADRRQFDAVHPPKDPASTTVGKPLAALAERSAADEDHELAETLMMENPRQFSTYEAAIVVAERRNNEKRADALIARLTQGSRGPLHG